MSRAKELALLLERAERSHNSVMSVILDVDQSHAENMNRRFETAFRSAVQRTRSKLPEDGLRQFDAAADAISGFLASYVPAGTSLLVVYDSTDHFLWSTSTTTPVRTAVHWSRTPHIQGLIEMLSIRKPYVAVVAESGFARLVHVSTSGIQASESRRWDSNGSLRHVKTTGSDHAGSASHFQRRADAHLQRALKELVQDIERFLKETATEAIVLAGTPEITSQLEDLLPERLRGHVIGSVRLSPHATDEHLIAETRAIADRFEKQRESRIVNDLITLSSKEHRAVTGFRNLAEALNRGQLWKLVYSQGAQAPGLECAGCRALYPRDTPACESCDGALVPVDDFMEKIVERVARTGGLIDVVQSDVAHELLRFGEGIGGFLRLQDRA